MLSVYGRNALLVAEIGQWGRAYAIDLLGYGYSDKPAPSPQEPNTIYNFDTWAGMAVSALVESVLACTGIGTTVFEGRGHLCVGRLRAGNTIAIRH